jgi:hypothetical protein
MFLAKVLLAMAIHLAWLPDHRQFWGSHSDHVLSGHMILMEVLVSLEILNIDRM